jgi:succinyl-CoA synthetase alpha subunit
MGHAGAIIEGEEGTAASQIAVLEKAGATIPWSSLDIRALKISFRRYWHLISK